MVDPLSSAHVPGLLRKALPFALSHSGNSARIAVGTSHIIQKRSLESTLDPLLANIFGVDPNPIINPSPPPSTKTTTTISSIATTSSMMALQPKKKTPKPKLKPIFNDGQKLDNSRDWEKVKIAQPPIEDLTVQEITTLDPIAEHKETLHDITELLTDDNDNEDVANSRTEAPLTHSSSSQGKHSVAIS